MSVVIAAMKKNSIIMAGDTQLHDENGAIKDLGMKVFPIGEKCLVGMVGDYHSYLDAVNALMNDTNLRNCSIEEKANRIKGIVMGRDNNVIIAQLYPNESRFVVMGHEYGYENFVGKVTNSEGAEIRILLPNGVTTDFCKPYITSLDNLRDQLSNCIEAVSTVSDSVNNKVCGLEINRYDAQYFCKNVNYGDINIRIKWDAK